MQAWRDFEDWDRERHENFATIERRKRIEAMPRVHWICRRNWLYSHTWTLGAMWGKRLDAAEGEIVYAHELSISLDFRLWIRRR